MKNRNSACYVDGQWHRLLHPNRLVSTTDTLMIQKTRWCSSPKVQQQQCSVGIASFLKQSSYSTDRNWVLFNTIDPNEYSVILCK